MGPKQTPTKPGNTLFSYFCKRPTNDDSGNFKSPCHDVLSPKRSPNNKSKNGTPKSATKMNGVAPEQEVGDLVWAKLEGYPWWPSLVCTHPTDNVHVKSGKNPQVHVQFFDDPPSRAWVKAKNVKPFKGSDDQDFQKGGPFYSLNAKVRKGAKSADDAVKLSLTERLALVVELQPSDDEEEDESMEFDPDIFDDEMEDETDNSKENEELNGDLKETSKSKTPSKSPKKTPSTRKSARKPKPKRRRIVDNHSGDDDSEDEFKPHSDEDSEEEDSSGVDEDDISEPDTESESGSPVKMPPMSKKRKRPAPAKNHTPWKPTKKADDSPEKEDSEEESKPKKRNLGSFTPTVTQKTKSKLASFTAVDTGPITSKGTDQESNFPHVKFDFLQPDKIKDARGKSRTDPEYDPRTLHLPESFKKQLTPALRQWWELKSKLFDTVLFFKMGKFYELFHMDAVVAVNELGLIYMKGEHAHSGFPEIAYNRYADSLIQKGYKVARIEQTETPDMMNERIKNMSRTVTKFDKVVKREVCRITSRGTQTFNFLDGDCSEAKSSYLLAICEKEEGSEGCSSYGVCFVDTSIGKFHIGQFTDDRHCSRLRTLIAHFTPSQVLIEKGKMSEKSQAVINNNLTSVIKEYLRPGTEFWDSSKTLKVLAEEDYFRDEEFQWPVCMKKMISDADTLGLSAADEYNLAIRALGALTWYLQFCLLDQELLSMKNFEEYTPLDVTTACSPAQKSSPFSGKQHMVLDGVTLANLDITENSTTGSTEGTLLERLDQCRTPFGKRLFKQWLCAPLCNPASINDRLDAVDDLNSVPEVVAEVVDLIRKLPDLEKILSRIHSLGSAARTKNHPDSRAIMFDEAKYSKKKIEDFLTTLDGFKTSSKVARKFKDHVSKFKSKLLRKTITLDSAEGQEGHFPDLKEELQFFDNAFDHDKARKDGVIVPSKGVDPDYDQAKLDIQTTERALDNYLDQQRTRLGCRSIVYWGSGKNRYQMEIPESAAKRVPDQYELMSSKKGAKRYRTKEIERHLVDLVDAEERKDAALKDTMRRIFHSFDERYKKWDTALQCLSVLDVLMSLAKYNQSADGIVCRPEVISPDKDTEPYIEIREARHPCISRTFTGGDFIPNDTVVGIMDENDMEDDDSDNSNGNSKIVLVTGPNMGGKSTLMRQVGLITIMAQMGCYVPAEKCRLTPVDRVFTRLGASDRIMAGESTFFVELSETSAILQHATKHSLVLMDELGRGTATYDGTAIACSVVNELSQRVQCRTLFSTHYHTLVEEFSHDPNIRLGHMACMVENEDKDDPSQETITFLYKFAKGACPKSYGFNAARLANIPEEVIKVAVHKSKEFEETVDRVRVLKSLWMADGIEKIKGLQPQICVS